MSQGRTDQDYLAVTTPTTPAAELQRIAAERPDLHPQILVHPNVYPDLAAWIQQQTPVVKAVPAPEPIPEPEPISTPEPIPALQQIPPPETIAAPEPLPAPQDRSLAQPIQPAQAAPPAQSASPADPTQPAHPVPSAQPASAQPAPAAALAHPPVKKKQKKQSSIPSWAMAAIGVVLVVGVAVALWFFLGDEGAEDRNAYQAVPTTGAVVDVSTFGRDVTLVPIGSEGRSALQVGSTRIVGFQSVNGPGIAGIDPTSASALPQWIMPINNSPAACFVSEETVNCGEGDTYKISGALAEPVAASGSAKDEDAREAAEETTEEAAQKGAASPSSTILLENSATEEVPYGVSDGMLVSSQGEEMLALEGDGPYYALAPASKGGPWIVSNGRVLTAVSGNDELWSVELPDGALEANGFDAEEGPSWSVSANTLLVGEPEGILALDAQTGEEVWHLDADVSSWRVDHQELLVSNGSSIAVMEFPKEDAGQGEAAQSGPAEVSIGGEQEEPAQTPLDDLLDATLEVPGECAQPAGLSDPVTFNQGRAKGDDGSILMTDVSSLLVEGELLDAVAFSCESQVGAVPAVAVYSQDLELWGVPDFLQGLPAGSADVTVEGLLAEGSALQVLLSGPGAVCDDCKGREVQVTMVWDGEMFVATAVGDPGPVWKDPTNTEKVETGPLLTPEDLANITLVLPVRVWDPDGQMEQLTFADYTAFTYDLTGETEVVIFDDKIVDARVNGEDFLFAPIVKIAGGISIVGGICAISMDADVVCANNPTFGQGFVWVDEVSVDGDLVTYIMVNGDTNETATVTQRFDGNRFTMVSSTV